MRIIKLLCLPAVFSLCLFFGFSSISAKAIDPSEVMQLSPVMFSSMIGDTVQGYYVASDSSVKPVTLSYWGYTDTSSIDADGFPVGSFTGTSVVWYRALYPSDYRYIDTGDPLWLVDWNLHFDNVTYFKSFTGDILNSSLYNVYATTPTSQLSPLYYIHVGDVQSDIISLPSRRTLSGFPAEFTMQNSSYGSCLPFEVEQDSGDLYIGTCNYCCVASAESYVWIGFACPEINTGYTFVGHGVAPADPVEPPVDWGEGESIGEVTGTIQDDGNGTQNINVTVNTDNTGFLAGILNGIRNLFVPSAEDIEQFSSDMQEEFSDHLGGLNDIWELLDEQADYLSAAVSTNYVYFPELEIPLDGEDYTIIEGQQVELRPANTSAGLSVLWEAVALAVDIVCVLAVLNMLQTKYEIFLNPDGEVITYDS